MRLCGIISFFKEVAKDTKKLSEAKFTMPQWD